jgi:multidrug efflux pump
MGIWVLPSANSLEVIHRVREAMPGHPGAAPGRHEGRDPVRLDRVHRERDARGDQDPVETLLIVVLIIFLFLGSVRALIIRWWQSRCR